MSNKTRRQSETLFRKIAQLVPGGVDGNAKVFAHDLMPVVERAEGCRIYDLDGHTYIDYCAGYGPLIFGHGDPDIRAAVGRQLEAGVLFGLPHPLMYEAARLVTDSVPCAEMVRFTNSGTEATLSAIRLARAFTGRAKVLKFYGAYHGTHEFVLHGTRRVRPELLFPEAEPNSAGITAGVADDILVLPFNDVDTATAFIREQAEELAAVVVEPVLGAFGIVASQAFLEGLRKVTNELGVVLIFDEVITGFRLALGGAQERFGVQPDLVTLGKALAGGLPVGAFAGRRELMELVVPTGDPRRDAAERVYHSGTYNSNPLVLAAVVASIDKMKSPRFYEQIDAHGERLRQGLTELMGRFGVPGTTSGIGSIVQWYFGIEGPLRTLHDTFGADGDLAARFHRALLERGVFFIAGLRGFVGTAQRQPDIDQTLSAMEDAFRSL